MRAKQIKKRIISEKEKKLLDISRRFNKANQFSHN
jgi:hypothetical protein